MIITDTRTHASGDVARAQVAELLALPMSSAREVDDDVALTIASWFASPVGDGAVFAQLATTGTVAGADLREAIAGEYERLRGDNSREGRENRDALNMLGTWSLHHA